ncbi:transfer protein spdA [Streptomyces sp. NPDC005784]|uniref:transfer protein spdA n=1 Tax=Streptomyces sp. NPDC005784 TaxID=3364731 RepID=UPI00367BC779
MFKRLSITGVVRCLALAAAMVISFAVERDLALSHGVPETVAPAVPVAVDLFMIWAVRTGRDVALAVAVAVAANVAGVLTTESLSAVDTWVSAGLHAVFPLTVWRMHRKPPAVTGGAEPVTLADSSGRGPDGPQRGAESLPDSWPDADLWQDFADSEADAEEELPVTPPTAEDVRAALAVLGSRDGRPVTGRMMADHFGVSERTGRRYLAMAA